MLTMNVKAMLADFLTFVTPKSMHKARFSVLLDAVTARQRHCCKVSDEAAFCLIQRPYISKTLLTRRISPRDHHNKMLRRPLRSARITSIPLMVA
ncbi:hypothetical protein FTV94_23795 (plasmid) [Escherichia coli]|nr:hypothetical protein FTV94_23795 [Escherichia coli]